MKGPEQDVREVTQTRRRPYAKPELEEFLEPVTVFGSDPPCEPGTPDCPLD